MQFLRHCFIPAALSAFHSGKLFIIVQSEIFTFSILFGLDHTLKLLGLFLSCPGIQVYLKHSVMVPPPLFKIKSSISLSCNSMMKVNILVEKLWYTVVSKDQYRSVPSVPTMHAWGHIWPSSSVLLVLFWPYSLYFITSNSSRAQNV